MKIVSWNCNGKFREKYKVIQAFNADIYVIQECENPANFANTEYFNFASNYIWRGNNKNRGLGVFAKTGVLLETLNWKTYCLKYFVPVKVNGKFDLLAVWACRPYIEEYYIYQNINISKYGENLIIIGDFNSNKIWDKEHGIRNHLAVVSELKAINLESAYHYAYGEKQGEETRDTFYMYRNIEKGYHIDHCFVNYKMIKHYEVASGKEQWVKHSDHVPIILETLK